MSSASPVWGSPSFLAQLQVDHNCSYIRWHGDDGIRDACTPFCKATSTVAELLNSELKQFLDRPSVFKGTVTKASTRTRYSLRSSSFGSALQSKYPGAPNNPKKVMLVYL